MNKYFIYLLYCDVVQPINRKMNNAICVNTCVNIDIYNHHHTITASFD